jgi:hypothetical protein
MGTIQCIGQGGQTRRVIGDSPQCPPGTQAAQEAPATQAASFDPSVLQFLPGTSPTLNEYTISTIRGKPDGFLRAFNPVGMRICEKRGTGNQPSKIEFIDNQGRSSSQYTVSYDNPKQGQATLITAADGKEYKIPLSQQELQQILTLANKPRALSSS